MAESIIPYINTYKSFPSDSRKKEHKQPVAAKGSSDEKTGYAKKCAAGSALAVIPYARRLIGLQDVLKANDMYTLGTKLFVLLNFLPEDTRDFKGMINQTLRKPYKTPRDFQTRYLFLRGTMLEIPVKAMFNSNNKTLKSISRKIFDADKTLYETRLGQAIMRIVGGKGHDVMATARMEYVGTPVEAFRAKGGKLAYLVGRTMLRIPLLFMGLFALFEIPAIVKAFNPKSNDKGQNTGSIFKNGTVQILKSAINVVVPFVGGAFVGAVLARKGDIGSIGGLGIGTYLGCEAANAINHKIDNRSHEQLKSEIRKEK